MSDPKHSRRELVVYGGEPTTPRPRSTGRKITTAARRAPALTALLATFAVAALSAGVVQTWTAFNDEVKVGVDVAAGTLNINVDGKEGNPDPVEWPLPNSLFKPGGTPARITMPVRNTGTLDAVVTASMVGLGTPTSLGEQLDVTLTAAPSGSPVVTKTGKANGATLPAFPVPAGGSVDLTVELTLPADSANAWQGKSDTLTLTLSAVQE